jgi:hypothetical protein
VERFIRCCEANRTRLAHDPQTKSNLMARVDAALDAPAMGGQYPPDRLIDYVFDVLNPVAPTSAKTWDSAAAAVSGEMEAKAASGTSEDRALKGDGSELGVIGADGSRRILDAEAARKAAKDRPKDPGSRLR